MGVKPNRVVADRDRMLLGVSSKSGMMALNWGRNALELFCRLYIGVPDKDINEDWVMV